MRVWRGRARALASVGSAFAPVTLPATLGSMSHSALTLESHGDIMLHTTRGSALYLCAVRNDAEIDMAPSKYTASYAPNFGQRVTPVPSGASVVFRSPSAELREELAAMGYYRRPPAAAPPESPEPVETVTKIDAACETAGSTVADSPDAAVASGEWSHLRTLSLRAAVQWAVYLSKEPPSFALQVRAAFAEWAPDEAASRAVRALTAAARGFLGRLRASRARQSARDEQRAAERAAARDAELARLFQLGYDKEASREAEREAASSALARQLHEEEEASTESMPSDESSRSVTDESTSEGSGGGE